MCSDTSIYGNGLKYHPYMEVIGDVVRRWMTSAGLSSYRVSRRAGVSASTMSRVLSNKVDPTVGTLQEIAIACGLQLHVEARPSSDPNAARAARSMLEAEYPEPTPEVEEWRQRLGRLTEESDNPVSIVTVAAAYAAPLRRQGAYLFSGKVPVGQIASAGSASAGQWAVSGAAGLYLPESHAPAPPPTILWCTEARRAGQILSDSPLESTSRPDRVTVAVIEAEPELFTGSFSQGVVTYAAPIQIMLDCLSLAGRVADDALTEVKSW